MGDSLNIDHVPAGPSERAADDSTAAAAPAPTTGDSPRPTTATAGADPEADGTSALVLTAPEPVATVAPAQAEQAVALDPATVARLDAMVADYLDAIIALDTHDPAFEARLADIRKLGDEDVVTSAQVSSRLLDRPVSAMQHGGLSTTSAVSEGLVKLRRQVEELDPARQGDLLSPRKLLGLLPFGDRLRAFFERYQSGQGHLNAIITSLHHGQDVLQKDNADIEQVKAGLWQAMERLRQYLYLARKLDAGLAVRISTVERTDAERAKVLREDMLFPVRQKVQDLATQLAVSVQGYLALDLIKRNNYELIRGVDRATTTTVAALRTAIIVSQALTDQKLVLDQVTALNTTTSNLIESTSALLRQQSAAIGEQAGSATIDLQKLQTAFDNLYATLDEIDAFRLRALDNMARTVDALTDEVGKAQAHVDRTRARDAASQAPEPQA